MVEGNISQQNVRQFLVRFLRCNKRSYTPMTYAKGVALGQHKLHVLQTATRLSSALPRVPCNYLFVPLFIFKNFHVNWTYQIISSLSKRMFNYANNYSN
jgi:hypothetical protein